MKSSDQSRSVNLGRDSMSKLDIALNTQDETIWNCLVLSFYLSNDFFLSNLRAEWLLTNRFSFSSFIGRIYRASNHLTIIFGSFISILLTYWSSLSTASMNNRNVSSASNELSWSSVSLHLSSCSTRNCSSTFLESSLVNWREVPSPFHFGILSILPW